MKVSGACLLPEGSEDYASDFAKAENTIPWQKFTETAET
jgi:hypothetical protein